MLCKLAIFQVVREPRTMMVQSILLSADELFPQIEWRNCIHFVSFKFCIYKIFKWSLDFNIYAFLFFVFFFRFLEIIKEKNSNVHIPDKLSGSRRGPLPASPPLSHSENLPGWAAVRRREVEGANLRGARSESRWGRN